MLNNEPAKRERELYTLGIRFHRSYNGPEKRESERESESERERVREKERVRKRERESESIEAESLRL